MTIDCQATNLPRSILSVPKPWNLRIENKKGNGNRKKGNQSLLIDAMPLGILLYQRAIKKENERNPRNTNEELTVDNST